MARICCVGLCCLDHIFRVPVLPQGGGKHFASAYFGAPGGPAAVAAIAIANLGHEAVFLGRVGDDDAGTMLIEGLQARGVDASHVRRVPGGTSQVSAVFVDAAGERMVVNHGAAGGPGGGLDPDPAWLPLEVLDHADVVLTDVRWAEGARVALDQARKSAIPSLIDADIAPYDTTELVSRAELIAFSEPGLALVAGADAVRAGESVDGALRRASSLTGRQVAVTRGSLGCAWLEGPGNLKLATLPGFSVEVLDTLCAGDVFHGALAVALAEGQPQTSSPDGGLREAMRFASAAAALKCARFGGSTAVPDRAAVDAFLAAHPSENPSK